MKNIQPGPEKQHSYKKSVVETFYILQHKMDKMKFSLRPAFPYRQYLSSFAVNKCMFSLDHVI